MSGNSPRRAMGRRKRGGVPRAKRCRGARLISSRVIPSAQHERMVFLLATSTRILASKLSSTSNVPVKMLYGEAGETPNLLLGRGRRYFSRWRHHFGMECPQWMNLLSR